MQQQNSNSITFPLSYIITQPSHQLTIQQLINQQLQQYNDVSQCEIMLQQPIKTSLSEPNYMHRHSNVIPIGTNYQASIPQILTEEYYKIKSSIMIKNLYLLKVNDPQRIEMFKLEHNKQIQDTFIEFQLSEEDFVQIYNNYKQYGNTQIQKYHQVNNQYHHQVNNQYHHQVNNNYHQIHNQHQHQINDQHQINIDYPLTQNCRIHKDVHFSKYLQKTKLLWEKYFKAKQRANLAKGLKRKKKRNKGSMPL